LPRKYRVTASFLGVLWGALLLTSPAVVQAQAMEGVEVGDRVRVQTEDMPRDRPWRSITGTIQGLPPDSVTIGRESAEVLTLPLSAVEKLKVSTGERGNALLGALVGGTVGFVFGAIINRPDEPSFSHVLSTGGAILLGGAAGYAVGNSIKSDNWQTVHVQRN